MKLSKAIEGFLGDLKVRRAAGTYTAYESDLNRFKFYIPMDTVRHVTPESIQAFLAASSATGLSMGTLHRRIACLRTFCRWGVKNGLWVTSPADQVEQVRKPRNLPRPFSDDEVNALLALELDARQTLTRALLLYTGLRVTPICNLKVGDISFAPPTLRALVKGAKVQVIKLHPGLAELLRAFIADETDGRAHTFLLADYPGHHPKKRNVERMTLRWGRRAGVLNCTPHRFRHSFGSKLYRQTRDIRLVQKAMGHDDIASTAGYTFVADQAEAEAVAGLEWGTAFHDRVTRPASGARPDEP